MKHSEESHSNQTAHWVDTGPTFSRRKLLVCPGARHPTLKSLLFAVWRLQRGQLWHIFFSHNKITEMYCLETELVCCERGVLKFSEEQPFINMEVRMFDFPHHLSPKDNHVYNWIYLFLFLLNWSKLIAVKSIEGARLTLNAIIHPAIESIFYFQRTTIASHYSGKDFLLRWMNRVFTILICTFSSFVKRFKIQYQQIQLE